MELELVVAVDVLRDLVSEVVVDMLVELVVAVEVLIGLFTETVVDILVELAVAVEVLMDVVVFVTDDSLVDSTLLMKAKAKAFEPDEVSSVDGEWRFCANELKLGSGSVDMENGSSVLVTGGKELVSG